MGDDRERVLFCGNLAEEATEEILYELFLQAGPLESVRIPKDSSGRNKNFAFVTFKHERSVLYTIALFKGIQLYGKELQLDNRNKTGNVQNEYLNMLMQHRMVTFPEEMFCSPNYSPNRFTNDRFSEGNTPHSVGRMSLPRRTDMNQNISEQFISPGMMRHNSRENRERSRDSASPHYSDRRSGESYRHIRTPPYLPPHNRVHRNSDDISSYRR